MTGNWIFDVKEITEHANRTLRKACEMEDGRLKNGWLWKKVHHNLRILVPCDKNGNPTKRGKEMIARYKEILRIG